MWLRERLGENPNGFPDTLYVQIWVAQKLLRIARNAKKIRKEEGNILQEPAVAML